MTEVTAITVTYGDRFASLCKATIERALAAGATRVVVVDNGSAADSRNGLAVFAAAEPRITIITNATNEGSAKAFAAGLEAARETSADYFWLLDDDNWTTDDVLSILLRVHAEEAVKTGDPDVAVAARRVPNGFHDRIHAGIPVEMVYPPRGAFLGFDSYIYLRRRIAGRTQARRAERPRIPYAPYGGLLVTPRVVDEIGLPPSSFILYSDDTSWTSRIVSAGHVIVLAAETAIEDAEGKWTQGASENSLVAAIRSPHTDRLYLSTRNRVYFDFSRAEARAEKLRYRINRTVVKSVAFIGALTGRSWLGLRTFNDAARDGERGDLSRSIPLA